MRNLEEIRTEIEILSERRKEILSVLAEGHDVDLVGERTEIEARIAALWDEHRSTRAFRRFGDRNEIIRKARAQERLERAA